MTECYQLVQTFTKSQRANRDGPVSILLTPGNLTEIGPSGDVRWRNRYHQQDV
jgi:hypothetical protein